MRTKSALLVATVLLVSVALGFLIYRWSETRNQASQESCIDKLRQIDAVKQQWALENKKSDNDEPTWNDLLPYIKNNARPICPHGGAYTIGKVIENPKCSIGGVYHTLPQDEFETNSIQPTTRAVETNQ